MKRVFISLAFISLSACSPKPNAPEAPAASEAATSMIMAEAPASSQTRVVPGLNGGPVAIGNNLSCEGPVGPRDTAKGLLALYKDQAKVATIPGAEGQDSQGVVLFGDDPKRRLEVTFWDSEMTHVSGVTATGDAAAWAGPHGLHLGSTVAEVEAANGRTFELSGFDWDYGGYVQKLHGGSLERLPGGCSLSIRFGLNDGHGPVANTIEGDRTLASTDAALLKAKPVVQVLSLGWPLPEGVRPDQSPAD